MITLQKIDSDALQLEQYLQNLKKRLQTCKYLLDAERTQIRDALTPLQTIFKERPGFRILISQCLSLIDENNKSKDFSCPSCGQKTRHGSFNKDGWFHSICQSCNLDYPTYPDELLAKSMNIVVKKHPKIKKWL